jgi:ribonuclease HII
MILSEAGEQARLEKLLVYEKKYYSEGARYIAGIDEVGRGALAGPVLACAVILPKEARIPGINDSKKLSEKKREKLAKIIKECAIVYSIGIIDAATIDEINILNATRRAMISAIKDLSEKPDMLLIDAVNLLIDIKQCSIVKGDALSMSIAAASIVAKTARDDMMRKYHAIYDRYGFDKNKGYGTPQHIAAIQKHGLCPIHRSTFTRKFVS